MQEKFTTAISMTHICNCVVAEMQVFLQPRYAHHQQNRSTAMIRLFLIFIALIFSTVAFGQDVTKEMQCRNGGALVMGSWHRLDLCLSYKKLDEKEVSEAKRLISKSYPKIGREVATGSDLSLHMKEIANALPYDFSDETNIELLASICKSSIGAMRRYVEPDWQKELVCWK